jgi:hypothetical protein
MEQILMISPEEFSSWKTWVEKAKKIESFRSDFVVVCIDQLCNEVEALYKERDQILKLANASNANVSKKQLLQILGEDNARATV